MKVLEGVDIRNHFVRPFKRSRVVHIDLDLIKEYIKFFYFDCHNFRMENIRDVMQITFCKQIKKQ